MNSPFKPSGMIAFTLACVSARVFASPIIDNVNGSASPPFLCFTPNTAGWVYTPNVNFNLDGVYSTFDNVGSPTTQGPVATRTVTLSVFDKNPSGALLARTTFTADGAGGNLGGNFPPILLLAGHDYFIGYDNIYNIGLNIANWMPNQAPGTVNLNGWYYGTNWATYIPRYDVNGVLQVFSAPILRFEGTNVTVLSSTDCLLNWAEKNYSELFSPAGAVSQTLSTYYFRYYKNTNTYVGISSANNRVYYLGGNGNLLNVGDLSSWLTTAGC
jgi:hypothetical protein